MWSREAVISLIHIVKQNEEQLRDKCKIKKKVSSSTKSRRWKTACIICTAAWWKDVPLKGVVERGEPEAPGLDRPPRPGIGFRRPQSTPPTCCSAPWWARGPRSVHHGPIGGPTDIWELWALFRLPNPIDRSSLRSCCVYLTTVWNLWKLCRVVASPHIHNNTSPVPHRTGRTPTPEFLNSPEKFSGARLTATKKGTDTRTGVLPS